MNRALTLAALNRKMLELYSRRTSEALKRALPLRVALPRLEPFLALNVAKEVQKDALVIRRVGEAFDAGLQPDPAMAQQLFVATKEIDRGFLARTGSFPVGIVIRYEEIAPLRTQRIQRLQAAIYRILDAGRRERGFRSSIRSAFPRADLQSLLHELLRLYAMETRVLSHSLRMPALLVPVRERLALSLYNVMNDAAIALARELTGCVYRPGRR